MDLNRLTADSRPGTMLAREWNGRMQRVAVLADGFAWNGKIYPSLSKIDRIPSTSKIRPLRSENRALLVASVARGRRWLDELITDPAANTESFADRKGCSVRRINMTISLAFSRPTS